MNTSATFIWTNADNLFTVNFLHWQFMPKMTTAILQSEILPKCLTILMTKYFKKQTKLPGEKSEAKANVP